MNAASRAKARYNKKKYKTLLIRYKTDDCLIAELDKILKFRALAGETISRNQWILMAIREKLCTETESICRRGDGYGNSQAKVRRKPAKKSFLDKVADFL